MLAQIASIGAAKARIVTSGAPILRIRAAAGKDLFGPAYGGTQFCIRLSLASPLLTKGAGREGDHLPQQSPPVRQLRTPSALTPVAGVRCASLLWLASTSRCTFFCSPHRTPLASSFKDSRSFCARPLPENFQKAKLFLQPRKNILASRRKNRADP